MKTSKTMSDKIQEAIKTGELVSIIAGQFKVKAQIIENGESVIVAESDGIEFTIRKESIDVISSKITKSAHAGIDIV